MTVSVAVTVTVAGLHSPFEPLPWPFWPLSLLCPWPGAPEGTATTVTVEVEVKERVVTLSEPLPEPEPLSDPLPEPEEPPLLAVCRHHKLARGNVEAAGGGFFNLQHIRCSCWWRSCGWWW